VGTPPCFYTIRVRGRLGATALSAFPSMACELKTGDTVLTGRIEDQSALFGVLAQIEALGLDLLELRRWESPASGEDGSPGSRPSCGDEALGERQRRRR